MKIVSLNKILWLVALSILALSFCGVAHAASQKAPPSSFMDTSKGFLHFFAGAKEAINNVLADASLSGMALTFWKVFSVSGMLFLLFRYAAGDAGFIDIFMFLFSMLITKVLMHQYNTLTSAMWGWSEGFAEHLELATTGQTGIFWMPRYIWNAITSMSFGTATLFHPLYLLSLFVMEVITVILALLGMFAAVWGLWGFALSKMVGFMFVPFLLFEKMSWVFDGWLRWFVGFLLYNVLSRANLVLVVVALQEGFGLPSGRIPLHHIIGFHPVYNLADMAGTLCFLIIAIVGLLSTGRFVAQIVGGGNFNLGTGIRQVASGAAKAVAAFI